MNRDHLHEKTLYQVANGAVLAGIGLFNPIFGIVSVTWENILVLFFVFALYAGVSLLPAGRTGPCLLLAVVCLGMTFILVGVSTCFAFVREYVRWCAGYGGLEEWLGGIRLLHTAVIAAVSLLIQALQEKFRIVKMGLACACVASMLICLFARISFTHMGVVFMLLYVLTVCVEWLQEHWKKALWLSPFLVIYLLLLAVMPAPEKPYDWQWAKVIGSQIRESFLMFSENLLHGSDEDFGTALSGFTDDGSLRGDIREDDRTVMRIRTQDDFPASVYLTGKIYDTFDGGQWRQEYRGDGTDRFADTVETLYAIRRLDDGYQGDYLRETFLNIRYESFHTRYVFVPLKTRSIAGTGTKPDYYMEGNDLVFTEQKGYGTEYDVIYYQMNVGTELFARLLEETTEPDEELWENITGEYKSRTGQEISHGMIESHRQAIYENYLRNVPLSEEVESYLAEITEGAGTDLDRLRAIERELSSYTYMRTPGALPDEAMDAGGFLDYFLLESRQGYCTHFATAFVLLARAEGIPARYVQGFCVPKGEDGETVVSSGMAHSWPEVYIEDVGWIPFEPTPGYGRFRYAPWEVGERESVPVPVAGDASYEREHEAAVVDSDEEDSGQRVSAGQGYERIVRMIAIIIATVLAGSVLVLAVDNLIGMYRYRRMSPEGKMKAEVRKNLRLLSWLGLKREQQETLQEFSDRGLRMPQIASLHFIEDYEDMLYGGKVADENMFERAKEERGQLWGLLKKEKRLTYVFFRLRMLLSRYR